MVVSKAIKDLGYVYDHKLAVVVGGAGFIGRYLVEQLLLLGSNVLVVDNFSRGKAVVHNEFAKYVELDASDIPSLYNLFASNNVDFVFNLAASVAGVLYNQSHHFDMYYSNMSVLTAPVLAAADAKIENFLQTSSVCVYSPEHNSPSEEPFGLVGEPHRANAGYAEAKRDGERFAMWSDIPHVVIVRPSNVAGDGDYFDDRAHVIPAFIKRAASLVGSEFKLYGDPEAEREFIYAGDVAWGMLYAMAHGDDNEAYNIGCNGSNVISMENLALKICELVHDVPPAIVVDSMRGGGDSRRWSNTFKLNSLGWNYQTSLDDIILSSMTDYFINHRNGQGETYSKVL